MAVYFLIVDTGLPIAFKGRHTSPCNWFPEELNAGTCPKIQTALNSRVQSWFPHLDFEAKITSLHNGICPHDMLQGLVLSGVPTLMNSPHV